MLEIVISGGQTGADQGGLEAAKACGIPTGGMLPLNCKTETGPNYNLLAEFQMQESIYSYPARTSANVGNSDATVRIATDFNSPGERCTLKALRYHNKPYLDIDINNPPDPAWVAHWISAMDIDVLNVAGNCESTCPGLQRWTREFLIAVFRNLKAAP